MVDRDKIRNRKSGGGDSSSKSRKSSKKSKKTSKKSTKSSTTKSRSSGGTSSKETKKDIKNMLMAIGNTRLFVEGVKLKFEDEDSVKANVSESIAKDLLSKQTEFAGLFKVREIASKYGLDWEEDILQEIMENQNTEELVEEYE